MKLKDKRKTNLDIILKSRCITLPTKAHLIKAIVFPAVMYGYESWTIKKAEQQRIDAFELWCWRQLVRVPWTVRGSNQSILKEISPKYSLEGLMLKLKLQFFGHLMRRTDPLEKTLLLGKIECTRRRGWQSIRWLDDITDSMDMSLSKPRGRVMDREVWHAAVHGVTKSWTGLSDWTDVNKVDKKVGKKLPQIQQSWGKNKWDFFHWNVFIIGPYYGGHHWKSLSFLETTKRLWASPGLLVTSRIVTSELFSQLLWETSQLLSDPGVPL